MKLKRYCVTNFRSVKESGWIECDDVTTLVGINESGKSNLLLALWKLNPARDGNIDILHDMPVSKLSTYRQTPEKIKFISAEFEIDKESSDQIFSITKCRFEEQSKIIVSRYYDGSYKFEFPDGYQKMFDESILIDSEQDPEVQKQEKKDLFDEEKLNDAIKNELPKFVYYSNYGNLSSKIYLPNVIKWLNGKTVQGIEVNEDQVRTLRVLFDFVDLNPEEILELGKDPKELAMKRAGNNSTPPNQKEIDIAEKSKEERSILLQSASVKLTKQFKEWWKQGEYKFRFEADGDYFRIWVSDNIRPDEVGLELRSTGLQWFLSFYLIFLVESQEQHKDAVLLLDEAGLTLHPLAQKDLAHFFEGLSEKNQIINTTHSPFIIDTSNIDRCRVVYMDQDGYTVASSDLRQGADALNAKSIYAVHAAMGLSVSDILLQGCQPVIVEGPSDQYYFNAIKSFLIRENKIAPKREMVFVPSGGVKGVSGVVSILGGKTEELPYVILDSDKSGLDAKKKLLSGLYKNQSERVLEVKDFLNMENSEVEDLFPYQLQEKGIDRLFRNYDEEFEQQYLKGQPIVPQIEEFAKKSNAELEKGWKVELAKAVKQRLKNKTTDMIEEYVCKWEHIFEKLNS